MNTKKGPEEDPALFDSYPLIPGNKVEGMDCEIIATQLTKEREEKLREGFAVSTFCRRL